MYTRTIWKRGVGGGVDKLNCENMTYLIRSSLDELFINLIHFYQIRSVNLELSLSIETLSKSHFKKFNILYNLIKKYL